MTCIVGWVEDGKVHMGGDSAGVGGYALRLRADEKVFINENMIFGFTSSFRMGQLLRFSFKPPEQSVKEKDDYKYMCTSFIDEVARVLEKKKYATIDSNELVIGTFLVGYRGNLYRVESDLQVGVNRFNYDACGCGENYALGSLHAMAEYDFTPEQRVEKALEIAHEFSAGVRPPFVIKSI